MDRPSTGLPTLARGLIFRHQVEVLFSCQFKTIKHAYTAKVLKSACMCEWMCTPVSYCRNPDMLVVLTVLFPKIRTIVKLLWQLPPSEARNPPKFPNKECSPGPFLLSFASWGCGSQGLYNRSNPKRFFVLIFSLGLASNCFSDMSTS